MVNSRGMGRGVPTLQNAFPILKAVLLSKCQVCSYIRILLPVNATPKEAYRL